MAIKQASINAYYHATLAESLDSIKKHGLDSSKGKRQWDAEYYLGNRKSSVFLSKSLSSVIEYIESAKDSPRQYWSVLQVFLNSPDVLRDGKSYGDLRYVGVIPPEFIRVVGTKTAFKWSKTAGLMYGQ
jgi:hypothetical protein